MTINGGMTQLMVVWLNRTLPDFGPCPQVTVFLWTGAALRLSSLWNRSAHLDVAPGDRSSQVWRGCLPPIQLQVINGFTATWIRLYYIYRWIYSNCMCIYIYIHIYIYTHIYIYIYIFMPGVTRCYPFSNLQGSSQSRKLPWLQKCIAKEIDLGIYTYKSSRDIQIVHTCKFKLWPLFACSVTMC